MSCRKRHLALAAGFAIAAAATVTSAAAAAPATRSNPVTTIAPPAGQPSVNNETVQSIAGSAEYLVYGTTDNDTGAQTLMVSHAGQTRVLQHRTRFDLHYSITGTTLAALGDTRAPHGHRVVDIWNLRSRSHRTVILQSGQAFGTAAPDGGFVALTDNRSRLTLHHSNGHSSPLGSFNRIAAMTAGPTGLVVTNTTSRFVPWSDPGHPVALDTGAPAGDLVTCGTVERHVAGCASYAGAWDMTMLVPLDGSAPTTTSTDCPGPAAAVGDTLGWITDCGGADSFQLKTLTAGGSTLTSSAIDPRPPVGGLGMFVVPNTDNDALLGGQTANTLNTVVASRPSPTAIDSFALTANRVYSIDTAATPSSSADPGRLVVYPLSTTSKRVRSGSGTVLATDAGRCCGRATDIETVAASGATYVYAVATSTTTWTLHVSSPGRRTTIDNLPDDFFKLAGNHLAYQTRADGHAAIGFYTISTGTTRILPRTMGGGMLSSVALTRHYIAFLTRGRVIKCQVFGQQHAAVVARVTRLHRETAEAATVYASGNWVGWDVLFGDEPAVVGIRDVKTKAPAVSFKRRLWSLTPRGAVLVKPAAGGGYAEFWLHRYSGATQRLLPPARYQDGPQITGHIVAWLDPQLRLKAERLPPAPHHR